MTRPYPKFETQANLPVGERWLAAVPVLVAVAVAAASRLGPLVKAPAWLLAPAQMAPLVSDAMWLLGLALIVVNWRHRLPAWRVIAAGAAGLLIVGLIVFGAHLRSVVSVSLGLMAAVVLLVALAPDRRSRWKAGGLVVALLLLTGHGIILLGHHFNVPLVRDPQLTPAAWTTTLALAALSFALVITCGAAGWFVRDILGEAADDGRLVPHLVKRQRRLALLVLGLVFVVVAAGGYLYLRSAIQQQQASLAAELTQIADLKAARIEAWVRERKADAATMAHAPIPLDDRAAVERYLDEFRQVYDYREIAVLDRTWTPVATASTQALSALNPALIEQAIQTPEVLVEDLALMPDGTVGMGFIAPRRTPDGVFAGAIRLRVDAAAELFPIIQSWPVQSETAETLLIRREGLTVLTLSNLRFRPNTALRLRFPLGQRDLPAAVAALDRRVEFSEGVDYRGEPVLWLSRPIAGTPWVILAKADLTEAYAALRTDTWRVAGGFALGLLAVGLLIGNYWRSRQRYYERQHVETELERRAAVERLALVLKHAQDVILLIDENMRIVEANDRSLEIYGYTPQEMRSITVADLRTAEAAGSIGQDFTKALAPEGLTFETVHRRKDGSTFPVEVSSRAVEVEGRRHVLSIIRDITERKAMEEELKRQEARFRFIFEHAPVGICLEVGDCEVLANEEHVRITGVAAKDSGIPGIFAHASHPEDYARQLLALKPFQRGEVDEFKFEKRYLHPDGRTIWARMNSHWFLDPASGKRRWLTILSEITEQKLQEEELRHQSAKFRFIFDHMPVGVSLRTSASGLEVNAAHVRLTGVAAADSNRPGAFAAVTHPEDYARQLELTEPFLRGEADSFSLEKRYLHPDGRIVWVEFSTCNFIEPATGERQALTTITDITARKRMEEALKREEARFRFIFERAPVGVSLILENGEVMVNPAHARISGVPVEDSSLPGIFAKASHPEDYARQLVAAEPFARNEVDQYSFEKRYVHADGRTVWARLTSHWFINPATHQRQVLTIVSDISEQKEKEIELTRQSAKFQFIYDHLPVGVSLWTKAGGLELNPAYVRLSGIDPKEANRPGVFTRATHPEDHIRQREITARFDRGEIDSFSLEKRYIHPDGTVVWVEFTSHRFTEPATGEQQTLTTVTDITERKAAAEALRSREEIFSNIVVQAVDAIALFDIATGRFIEFNRAAHEGLGYAREEFAELGLAGIQAEHSSAEIGENVRRIMTEGSAVFETRHRHRGGELRDVRVSCRKFTLDCIAVVWTDITEHKQAHVALEASEAKFRRLLQMVPLPLAHADRDGRITFANDRFTRIFGYSLADVPTVGTWWERAYPDPRYREELQVLWNRALQQAVTSGGEIATTESRITSKDGRVRTVEISGMILGEETLVAFVDITERVETERKLRQQSRIIEQAPLSIAITDLTGAIAYVNPRFCEVTGYTLDEVLDQNPRVLKSGKTAPEVYTQMWQTLSRGEVWRGELCNKKKNGDLYYEQAVIAPVTNDSGAITHYVALKEDITEQKRAERRLLFNRFVVENSGQMIWIDPANGRLVYGNRAAAEHFGYTPEELVTLSVSDIDPDFDLRQLPESIRQLQEAGKPVTLPFRHRLKDGSRADVDVTVFLAEDGERSLIISTIVNMTEQKRAEAALQAERERLQWLLDTAPAGIAISVDGIIRLANPRIVQMTTLEVGRPATQAYVNPEVRSRIMEVMQREGIARDQNIQMYAPNGEVRDFLATFIATEYGGRPGVLGWLTDITKLKAAEIAIRRAQEIAEEATKAKGDSRVRPASP